MLLSDYLPTFDFHEIHRTNVLASPARVFHSIKEVTVAELPAFRLLMGLRALPARLKRRARRGMTIERAQPLLEWASKAGFVPLAEVADLEIVFGIIGQMWKLSGGSSPRITNLQEFLAFNQPGYAKVVANFYIERSDADDSITLSTETRIQATDTAARRQFALYWRFIYPGSALIRKEWLNAIRRRAERGPAEARV
jgi:hypothetical protein